MISLLLSGFLIGGSHAFEADHVAAVSSLVAGKKERRQIIRHGVIWGLGHTLTLLVVAGALMATQSVLSPQTAYGLEAAVGLMLAGLGAHLVWRLRRDRVHLHRHSHSDGQEHLHLHSHAGESGPHRPQEHRHKHPDRGAIRTLLVGTMHGLAGSAAIVLTLATSVGSPSLGLAYVGIFGLGSIVGMAVVSGLLSIPLYFSARFLSGANTALQLVIGVVTCGLGLWIMGSSIAHVLA